MSLRLKSSTHFLINIESVRAKIAGEIKGTSDKGYCICYFEATEELYYWTYDELRAIVGK